MQAFVASVYFTILLPSSSSVVAVVSLAQRASASALGVRALKLDASRLVTATATRRSLVTVASDDGESGPVVDVPSGFIISSDTKVGTYSQQYGSAPIVW